MSTVIGFVAEVGDIGRFTDPKQIQKLAGLEIVKRALERKKVSQESVRGADENYEEPCMSRHVR